MNRLSGRLRSGARRRAAVRAGGLLGDAGHVAELAEARGQGPEAFEGPFPRLAQGQRVHALAELGARDRRPEARFLDASRKVLCESSFDEDSSTRRASRKDLRAATDAVVAMRMMECVRSMR